MVLLSLVACMIWKKPPLFGQSSSKNYSELSGDVHENIYYLLSLMTHRYHEELSNYYNVINCNSCIGFW
jgi:hypothetical protein